MGQTLKNTNNINVKNYYIFSDESGVWGNEEDKYYIRSWIKLPESEYHNLEENLKETIQKKKITLPSKLKITFLNQSTDIKEMLFNPALKIEIMFTFTILDEFYSRKFIARKEILKIVKEAIEKFVPHKDYIEKIPIKIKSAINNILFLNIYEIWHILNAFERLVEENNTYKLIMDEPQFTKNDYKELFHKIVISYFPKVELGSFKKVEKSLGVKIADLSARLFRKILEEKIEDEELQFFKNTIAPLLTSRSCNFAKGVNKVFIYKEDQNSNLKLYIDDVL